MMRNNSINKNAQAAAAGDTVTQLFKLLDEAGAAVSPALRSLIEGVGQSARGIKEESDDIAIYVMQILEEVKATRQGLEDGSILARLAEAEKQVEALDAKRLYHYKRYLGSKERYEQLAESMTDVISKHDAAKEALKAEKLKVDQLQERISALKQAEAEALRVGQEAQQKLIKGAEEQVSLIRQLDEAKEGLGEAAKRADTAESTLETLKKEHGELVEKYKELKAAAEESRRAASQARSAGDDALAETLETGAKAKQQAADGLKVKITKGDPNAAKLLDEAAEGAEAAAKGTGEAAGEAAEQSGRSMLGKTYDAAKAGVGMTYEATKKALKWAGLYSVAYYGAIIAGIGAVMYWAYYVRNDRTGATRAAGEFDRILRTAHERLSKVSFIEDSVASQVKESYLQIMSSCFGLLPEMVDKEDDEQFIRDASKKLVSLLETTNSFLDLSDVHALDLATELGWSEALDAITQLRDAFGVLEEYLRQSMQKADTQKGSGPRGEGTQQNRGGRAPAGINRPEPSLNDKGIDVLGQKIYLSQYPEIDPATRSAIPHLLKRVLLTPTGLSFWDPEGKWGGGFLPNSGTLADQVIRHVKFFMNPRIVDSDWGYGPINNERKLRKFMRKNMPKPSKSRGSGYKSTRREYKRNRPRLAFSGNIQNINMETVMKNREKRLQFLEKVASSTNKKSIFTENIEKIADSVSKQFYQDALRGLDDQYAKSYYTGLKSMYDQKLGSEKADYKSLYEPNGGTGTEILESSHPKTIDIADAMGRGGVVENVLEQQRHDIGVALSAPTGNFRGKHANLVGTLVKIANAADESNRQEISEIVDTAIEDIVSILKS